MFVKDVSVSSPTEAGSCAKLGINEISVVGKKETGMKVRSGKDEEWTFGFYPYETVKLHDGHFKPSSERLGCTHPVILTVADKVRGWWGRGGSAFVYTGVTFC